MERKRALWRESSGSASRIQAEMGSTMSQQIQRRKVLVGWPLVLNAGTARLWYEGAHGTILLCKLERTVHDHPLTAQKRGSPTGGSVKKASRVWVVLSLDDECPSSITKARLCELWRREIAACFDLLSSRTMKESFGVDSFLTSDSVLGSLGSWFPSSSSAYAELQCCFLRSSMYILSYDDGTFQALA
jgi:hypothetical protein